jgi:RHS repeat-associated protein
MTYSYTAGTNKISSMSDIGNITQGGFRAASGAFTYDNNGNQISNAPKGITSISYNHLNLPTNITLSGSRTIDFTYASDGSKLRKVVKTGATINLVQEYVNGIEYRGTAIPATTIEGIYHAEGRLYNNAGTWQREYIIKDHLGDTRITYCDIDGDGVIATPSEILQENNYDAFGYGLDGVYMNHSNPDNLYQYNGKEKNDDHGIGMYDYGARWYDAGVGRFNTVDRFAPKYASLNPYQYGANNPIKYIDVNGDSLRINTGGGNYAYYNNGALTNQDGTQYTGPGTKVRNNGSIKLKGELKSAVRSLNTIGSGVAGGELVSQIVGSTSTVTINSGDANSTLELSVTWNSSSLEGGLDERGSTSRPTYVGLAHELAHSLDNINGNKPGSIWETVNGKRVYNVEKGVSNFENRI